MRRRKPPEELTPAQVVARMKREAREILLDCEQAIRDGEYWMRLRPEERPLDLEWFKLMANQMRRVLAQLKAQGH